MISKFAELINRRDPAFITGFNDSKFDIPFLIGKTDMLNADFKTKFTIGFKKGLGRKDEPLRI